jgi:hypothetical protein
MRQLTFMSAFAALALAASHVPRIITVTAERISERFWSAVAFVVRTLAYGRPALSVEGFGGFMSATAPHYDAPSQSFLRHESHVSRRSADRHI